MKYLLTVGAWVVIHAALIGGARAIGLDSVWGEAATVTAGMVVFEQLTRGRR